MRSIGARVERNRRGAAQTRIMSNAQRLDSEFCRPARGSESITPHGYARCSLGNRTEIAVRRLKDSDRDGAARTQEKAMMTELSDFATDDVRALTASELDTVNGGVTNYNYGGRVVASGPMTVADAWNAFYRAAGLPAPF